MAQAPTGKLGAPCEYSKGDQFACDNSNFLECNKVTGLWDLQNVCTGSCFNDTSYNPKCFMVAAKSTSSIVLQTSPSTSTSTPTSSTGPSVVKESGLSTFGIIGIVAAVLVVFSIIAAALFVFYRARSGDESPKMPLKPEDVLNKRYIAVMDYAPTASDEVRLTVGDIVVLDLLFNDGWAKGKNETNKMTGILPMACLQEIQ